MKKVRYLSGIAALVPAAAAMAPAAAATAPTAGKPPHHPYEQIQTFAPDGKVTSTKRVALHAIDGGKAYAPSAAAGCTGHIPWGLRNHNHESVKFWYTHSGCVGTVLTKTWAGVAGVCAQPVVKYYANGTLVQSSHLNSYYCSNVGYYFKPHRVFRNPVGVWAHANVLTGGELGPVGATVNR